MIPKKVSSLSGIVEEIFDIGQVTLPQELKINGVTDRTKIGDSYEGLAKQLFTEILSNKISCARMGQVRYRHGLPSHKIDLCILNEKAKRVDLPYSENFLIAPNELLGLVEVKKTLSKALLIEDIKKVMSVKRTILEGLTEEEIRSPYNINYATQLLHLATQLDTKAADRLTPLLRDLKGQFIVHSALPFGCCIGFGGIATKETLLDAYREAVDGHRVVTWPDVVVCGDMSIVKLDGRPYPLQYIGERIGDIEEQAMIVGFIASKHKHVLVESLYEKINTHLHFSNYMHWESDTKDSIFPVFALCTHATLGLKFIAVDADAPIDYSNEIGAQQEVRIWIDE